MEARPKVFGVGVARTGTSTFGECMTRLGFNHRGHSSQLTQGLLEKGDIDAVMAGTEGHDSFDDWPWPLVYRQLDERYPDARFVLTVRRDSDTWFESMSKHVALKTTPGNRDLIFGHASPEGHRDEYVTFYEAHNAAVRQHFAGREGKLLEVCWETGSGWAELCGFLGVPVVRGPLPHLNNSNSFVSRHSQIGSRRSRRRWRKVERWLAHMHRWTASARNPRGPSARQRQVVARARVTLGAIENNGRSHT